MFCVTSSLITTAFYMVNAHIPREFCVANALIITAFSGKCYHYRSVLFGKCSHYKNVSSVVNTLITRTYPLW